MKGAAEKAAMGTPRSSFRHISASVPPTRVMGAEKAIPSMVLQTMRVPMFFATAHGIMKTTATRRVEPLRKGQKGVHIANMRERNGVLTR